jgi:hypothetical protein
MLRGVVDRGHDPDSAVRQRRPHEHAGPGEVQGHLVGRRSAVDLHVGESERLGAGHVRAGRPGAAETDAGQAADRAVHAVGGDHVPGGDGGAAGEGDRAAVQTDGLEPAQHLAAGRQQPVVQHGFGGRLRDHQRVRVAGRQVAEVDRDQRPVAVADGETWRRDAGGDQRRRRTDPVEDLEGVRVHHRGPAGVLGRGGPVDDRDGDAVADECGRGGQPHGSGTHDEDIGGLGKHRSLLSTVVGQHVLTRP